MVARSRPPCPPFASKLAVQGQIQGRVRASVMDSAIGKPYAAGVLEALFAAPSVSCFDRRTTVLLLLPGLTPALLGRLFQRSAGTIRTWRRRALDAGAVDPTVAAEVRRVLGEMTVLDGIWLARRRGPGPLPHWSRLAIKSMCAEGRGQEEVATLFEVHPRTVRNVCSGRPNTGFHPLSGVRRLTAHQSAPPGRWR